MTSARMIIEMDLETGKVKVGHPDSKIHCDYMLAEAKRILDRLDDKRAEERKAAVSGRIMVPDGVLAGANGGAHG